MPNLKIMLTSVSGTKGVMAPLAFDIFLFSHNFDVVKQVDKITDEPDFHIANL